MRFVLNQGVFFPLLSWIFLSYKFLGIVYELKYLHISIAVLFFPPMLVYELKYLLFFWSILGFSFFGKGNPFRLEGLFCG